MLVFLTKKLASLIFLYYIYLFYFLFIIQKYKKASNNSLFYSFSILTLLRVLC